MNKKLIIGIEVVVVLSLIGACVFLAYKILLKPAVSEISLPEEVFAAKVNELNDAVETQIKSIPQSLKDELSMTRIYFMLTNKADNHDDQYTQSFVFENGSFSGAQPKNEDEGDLYYSFSRNGQYGVFAALSHAEREKGNLSTNLYTYVPRLISTAFPTLAQATLIEDSIIIRKQNPSISNTGEVLFVGWEKSGGPIVRPAEDWSIFKMVDGKPQFITNGFMPKWITDTDFVFLKNDGLYIANSDASSVRAISTSTQPILSNNRIDVSSDGSQIVWMQSQNSETLLFQEIEGAYVQTSSLPGRGFWAAFSPSGLYLALQTINNGATGNEINPGAKIEFFDLATFTKIPELEIDLDAFAQDGMFMTDWVINN